MPTLNQLIRHGREEKRRTDRTRASDQCPQKQGVCPRVSTRTPKKPQYAPLPSYTIPEEELELGQSRLLEVDNRVVVPAKTHLRIIVTSADVPHSWAVPSSGVKCDAVPDRFNQISIWMGFFFPMMYTLFFIFFLDPPMVYAMEHTPPVDCTLRLGPPGQVPYEVGPSEAPNSLSEPVPPEVMAEWVEKMNARLLLAAPKKSGWQTPIETIQTLITLKRKVISCMKKLDPHEFWVEEEKRLISDAILTKRRWEYTPKTLEKRISQLNEQGTHSSFFQELRKLREDAQP